MHSELLLKGPSLRYNITKSIAMHSELLLKGPSLRYILKYSYHAASSGETATHLSSWASTSSAFTSLLK